MAPEVVADDSRVATVLTRMMRYVTDHGGFVHPGARLVERGGHLTVACDPRRAPPETHLFRMPRELLVPVTGAQWSDRSDLVELVAAPPGLSPEQHMLLDMFVDLYNACGKVPVTAACHPAAAPVPPPLLAAIRALQPHFRESPRSPAEVLLGCRVFGLHTAGPRQEAGGADSPPPRTQVLLPLIDLLDHDPAGAPFRTDDAAMTVQVAQRGTDETCFAHYGSRRDALGQALHYGYVDRVTPFAISAPVTVTVPGFGSVRVARSLRRRHHRLDPPRLSRAADGTLTLSHAVFDREHPGRLTGVVALAVRSATLQAGGSTARAHRAGSAVVPALARANLELLARVARTAAESTEPAAMVIAAAARAQAAVLTPFATQPGSEALNRGRAASR